MRSNKKTKEREICEEGISLTEERKGETGDELARETIKRV